MIVDETYGKYYTYSYSCRFWDFYIREKISEELGYKFMDTDDYFWLPTNPRYTTKRSKEERLALMKKDISEMIM